MDNLSLFGDEQPKTGTDPFRADYVGQTKTKPKKSSRVNRREVVWKLLSDCEWHDTSQICSVEYGGTSGTRRVRELRQEIREGRRPGYKDIQGRQKPGSDQWEYRLVRKKEGE